MRKQYLQKLRITKEEIYSTAENLKFVLAKLARSISRFIHTGEKFEEIRKDLLRLEAVSVLFEKYELYLNLISLRMLLEKRFSMKRKSTEEIVRDFENWSEEEKKNRLIKEIDAGEEDVF